MTGATGPLVLHASCVGWRGQACLILGPSGAGKSALALRMMALGAGLLADDRTEIAPAPDGRLIARCPPALAGLIEARGIGLLRAAPTGPLPVALAVDLGLDETERLPPFRKLSLLGREVDLVLGPDRAHLAASLVQYLTAGRAA
ncbi:MAG: HPr kinase/phosphatase C-terminal domain-containing protein [Rhodobacterales bacterium]|nr:HPr kinase/phosphatase C-terminal domain-containing protein [Rhodobacterales bacterium]